MSSRLLYGLSFLLCLMLAGLFSLTLPNKLEEAAVAEKGCLVTVQLLEGNVVHLGKRPSYFLYFRYNGGQHSTRVSADYYRQVINQPTVQLLHLAIYPRIFFAPGHNERGQVTSAALLIAFFVGLTLWSFFKLVKGE